MLRLGALEQRPGRVLLEGDTPRPREGEALLVSLLCQVRPFHGPGGASRPTQRLGQLLCGQEAASTVLEFGFPGVSRAVVMAEVDGRGLPGRQEDFGNCGASLEPTTHLLFRPTCESLQRTQPFSSIADDLQPSREPPKSGRAWEQ
ncbi:hypothetical protein EGK_02419 [Macaca mulatta]|uniref:Uncharacterized protein n=2 Tax=Macaca TaxID=9539 RepID=G7N4V2_MACMU|nr:hypothetical protein EGK_02419 [Macaca mulatta]EHH65348.1 hypothetical protein EGM_02095 [Macaca fascicularis]